MPTTAPRLLHFSRLLLALALLCLAAALSYFTYEVSQVRKALPQLLQQTDASMARLQPVLDQLSKADQLVGSILSRVDSINANIPPILAELQAQREQIPAVLQRVDAINAQIPPLLAQTSQLQTALPGVLQRVDDSNQTARQLKQTLDNYQPLVPIVVDEIAHTRTELPVLLDKADQLVSKAQEAGKKAAEGSVTGLVTGIFKMPVNMITSLANIPANYGDAVDKHLSPADREAMRQAAIAAVRSNQAQDWQGDSGNHGTLRASNYAQQDDQLCVDLQLKIYLAQTAQWHTVDRHHCAAQ